jgi:hypothetical protein
MVGPAADTWWPVRLVDVVVSLSWPDIVSPRPCFARLIAGHVRLPAEHP